MANIQNIIAVLDNIRSRENVGSIFRTADAAGIAKLYLCGITPSPSQILQSRIWEGKPPPQDKIAKTALGAEKYVPWEYKKQTFKLIENLKNAGYYIIALEMAKNAKDIFKIKFSHKNIALIIGSEVNGISSAILKRADIVAKIPMRGKKESLNVAVAFGIAAYQLKK